MKRTCSALALLTLGATLALSGCTINSQVPKTLVKGTIAGQPFEVSSPKDTDMDGLKIQATTNGTVTVSIKTLTTKMNPENITNTGSAMSELVKAWAEFGERMFNAGAAAAGKAAGAAAK